MSVNMRMLVVLDVTFLNAVLCGVVVVTLASEHRL